MTDLFDIFASAVSPFIVNSRVLSKVYSKAYCPPITKVIDKKPVTTVCFNDGSKASVKCSAHDTYNLETAILYAIVKRTFGSVNCYTAEAVCAGLGRSLKEIVEKHTYHAIPKKLDSEEKCDCKCSHGNSGSCKCNKASTFQKNLQTGKEAEIKKTIYIRPDKPFSQFTQEEKRAYWRWQKSKNK